MDGGGGGQIGWVWEWSGVGWWSMTAKLVIGGGGQIGQCVGEVGLGCLWISDEGGVELIFA